MKTHILKAPFPFVSAASQAAVPVIALKAKNLKAWLKKQDAPLKHLVEKQGFAATPGQTLLRFNDKGHLAGVLTGVADPVGFYDFAMTADALSKGLSADALKKMIFEIRGMTGKDATAACIGWALAGYRFTPYKKKNAAPAPRLLWPKDADRRRVQAFVEGICLTRDLVNAPANDMGPAELEKAARTLATPYKARVSVTTGAALLKNNFPMIYDVGKASARAPRLIDLRWGNPKHPKLTLVGKGVCFDSGGLNIKPSSGMLLMKKDMAGGAHTLGLALMIMKLKIPVRLRVLIPAVENSISGNAYRPKDILKSRKGLSVEVGDTDAEGRLVLADALTLACEEKPDLLIDMATLTGAARTALGFDIPAVFSNSDALAEEVKKASLEAGELAWPMPLWQPYKKDMNSDVADVNSTGSSPAGTIQAALFLDYFVEAGTPWVHLDIYGWETTGKPGRPRGGADTGLRAVFALIEKKFRKNAKEK